MIFYLFGEAGLRVRTTSRAGLLLRCAVFVVCEQPAREALFSLSLTPQLRRGSYQLPVEEICEFLCLASTVTANNLHARRSFLRCRAVRDVRTTCAVRAAAVRRLIPREAGGRAAQAAALPPSCDLPLSVGYVSSCSRADAIARARAQDCASR